MSNLVNLMRLKADLHICTYGVGYASSGPSTLCCSADVHLPTNVAATQTGTPGIYPPVC